MDESSKHGRVLQCCVDTVKSGGFIYMQLASEEEASRAAASLHGRFFAGRMILVSYLTGGQFAALVGALA